MGEGVGSEKLDSWGRRRTRCWTVGGRCGRQELEEELDMWRSKASEGEVVAGQKGEGVVAGAGNVGVEGEVGAGQVGKEFEDVLDM